MLRGRSSFESELRRGANKGHSTNSDQTASHKQLAKKADKASAGQSSPVGRRAPKTHTTSK
eukprot:5147676-Amphidinium_carterae.5